MTTQPFKFAKVNVAPGSHRRVELPTGRLPSGAPLTVPVEVLHGVKPGPTVWLSGAIHGDEIVGVEIIRQLLERIDETSISGTILAVPVVNVFGFVAESRYLPDRRDLNRSFPGSRRGSMASQLAHLFVDHIVQPSDVGIDFHAGSNDRTNLAQIRGNLNDEETHRLALAFGAPVAINSKSIRGTLRQTAVRRGKKVLLFEGGEPRRFSPKAVKAGVDGTIRVLAAIGMLSPGTEIPAGSPSRVSRSTNWVRAPRGGVFRLEARLGAIVADGDRMGVISGPAGRDGVEVAATHAGIVIGHAVSPIVHRGDALVHIAELEG